MKKSLQIVVGLLVSGFCLWFTFRGFDLASLRAQAEHYSLLWLLPAAALYFCNFAMRSFRWKMILAPIRPLRYWTVAPVLIFGFFMNSILPARGGEFARAIAISKKGGIPVSSALGSIMAERTFDLFGLRIVMLTAARLLPWERLPVVPIAVAAAVLIALMVAATIILPKLPSARSGLAQKVISFVAQIGKGFSVIKTPSKMIALILISVVIWFLDVTTILTVSHAAGLNFHLPQAAALLVGIAAGVMIPAAPGYVGTYEFFGKETLLLLGFEATPALAFVVFLHFFQMAMIVAMGIPSTLSLGLNDGLEKPR